MANGFFNSWLLYKEKVSLGLVAAPDPTKTRAILCNAAIWGSSATLLDVLLSELNQEFGYARHTWELSEADLTFDAVDRRVEVAEETWNQTATTASLQWNGVVILANAHATANRLITSVDAPSSTFLLANHNLNNGDRVILTPEADGALPGNIPSVPQFLYVVGATSGTFQVSLTLGGNPIVLSNAGILPLRVRYANGELIAGYRDNTSKVIPPSATRQFVWNFSALNTAVASGQNW